MRISSYKSDAGYSEWRALVDSGKSVKVFLDGIEQTKCSVADTEQGFVERCVLTAAGHVQVDPNNREQLWIERVEGDVRIELTDA